MQGTRCRTPTSVLTSVTKVEIAKTITRFLTRGIIWFGTISCKMPLLVAVVAGGPACVLSSSAKGAGRVDTVAGVEPEQESFQACSWRRWCFFFSLQYFLLELSAGSERKKLCEECRSFGAFSG